MGGDGCFTRNPPVIVSALGYRCLCEKVQPAAGVTAVTARKPEYGSESLSCRHCWWLQQQTVRTITHRWLAGAALMYVEYDCTMFILEQSVNIDFNLVWIVRLYVDL